MTTITEVDRVFAMPSSRQLASLRRRVLDLAPALAPKSDHGHDNHAENFTFAFAYIGSALTRTANNLPDQGRSMSWWSDNANFWHSQRGRSASILPSHMMAACLALNIAHTFDPQRWPFDAGIGVSIGGGKPIDADDWRGVLERGTLRPMSPLPPTYGRYQMLTPIQGAQR